MTGPRTEAVSAALTVTIRERPPVLPRIAFVLIGVASVLGTGLSNLGLGVPLGWLVPRWLSLWTAAAVVGFLTWRLAYLRRSEPDVSAQELVGYRDDVLARSQRVAYLLALLSLTTVPAVLAADHLGARPAARLTLLAAGALLTLALVAGPSRRSWAWLGWVAAAAVTLAWALGDAGGGVPGVLRALHLVGFGLGAGGALWNLAVAVPVGMRHPTIAAVTAGARQLQRFRGVARVTLPTVVVTGLAMARPYLPTLDAVTTVPGLLIAAKVVLIVALVVIFVTCPLYRQCSPLAGVCDLDDLDDDHRPIEDAFDAREFDAREGRP